MSEVEKHRLLIEHFPDAYAYHQLVTDHAGNPVDYIVLDVNRAFEKMTGLKKEGVVGKQVTEIYPGIKNDGFDWISTCGQVALQGESVKFQQYFELKDRWYDVIAYSDSPGYFAVIFRDITERKQAEEALRVSEQRYRLLVEHAGETIVVVQDGIVKYANPATVRTFGYSEEKLGSKPFIEFLHPEDQNYAIEEYTEVLNGKTIKRSFKIRVLTEKEAIKWIEFNAAPIEWENRPAVLGFARDITKSKQAEEELHHAMTQFKASFEGTMDAITLCDMESNTFVDCNERALTLFGFKSKSEFMQKHPSAYSPEDQPGGVKSEQRAREKIIEALKKNNAPTFEWVHQRNDGTTFFAEVTLTTYKLGNNTILQSNIRDISDRKQAEQKLADYTLELEQLYHHLDAELDKARQVHERTLPKALPTVEGISFAAHYQPAQKMGGDLYDVIHKDNKVIFYLSDVSGHGLDGAMLSVFVKHTIKSYISITPADKLTPAKILRYLAGQYGREDYEEELYFCIFIAALDLDTHEFSYCGAGFQEELLLQLGNGDRLGLAARGMFITSYLPAEMLTLKDQSVFITPGTTIFLTTDGLTEQRAQGVYYRDRLPEVFYANAHLPPDQVAQAIMEDFREFNNGSLQGNDDITFLVLKIAPPATGDQ